MRVYGYARVSTDEQSDSIAAQKEALREFMEGCGFEWGDLFYDEDWSAFKYRLAERPDGKRLLDAVAPGDLVVIPTEDRLCRQWGDAGTVIETWTRIGVRLYVLSWGREVATISDQMMFGIKCVMNTMESKQTGARVRTVWNHRKKHGKPYSNARPLGWIKKDGEYIPHPKERALGDEVVKMRAADITFQGIALALAKRGVKKPVARKGSSGYYSVSDVYTLHRAAVAGYPKLALVLLKSAGYAERLREAESNANQPVCAT